MHGGNLLKTDIGLALSVLMIKLKLAVSSTGQMVVN